MVRPPGDRETDRLPGERFLRIARKDFMDAVRARQVHTLVAGFALFGAYLGYFTPGDIGRGVFSLLVFLIPLVGVAFTQHAVAGKRESGELAVLLGLPFSRRDVVAGTYLGRTGVVLAAVVSAYAGAVLAGIPGGASFDPGTVALGVVLLFIVGTIFVGITLGVSAVARGTTSASVGAFVAFLAFMLPTWQFVPDAVLFVANGFDAPDRIPEWATAFDQFAPFVALRNAATPVAPDLVSSLPVVGEGVPPDPPLYMEPLFGAVVVVGWLVVPAGLGYLRFERSDL